MVIARSKSAVFDWTQYETSFCEVLCALFEPATENSNAAPAYEYMILSPLECSVLVIDPHARGCHYVRSAIDESTCKKKQREAKSEGKK